MKKEPLYARYTSDVHFRIGNQYKEMLTKICGASKKTESDICRNIFEGAILRRYKKITNNEQELLPF